MQDDIIININKNLRYDKKKNELPHVAIEPPVTGSIHKKVANPSLSNA